MQPSIKFTTRPTNDKIIPLTYKKIESMAYELMQYLIKHSLEDDTIIYYKTKDNWNSIIANASSHKKTATPTDKRIGNKIIHCYLNKNDDPNQYFKYNGEYLSVSSEGTLYDVLNGYVDENYQDKIKTELSNFFAHYGLYFEQGNTWNFSLYKM